MSYRNLRIMLATVLTALVVGFTSVLPVSAQSANGTLGQEGQRKTEQQADKYEDRKGENVDPVSGDAVKETSVVEYINDAYKWLALIGGLLAVIMVMYSGYRYMSSNGDPEKVSDAKNMLEQALLGLGLLILAAVILRTINPATVNPNPICQPNSGNIDFTVPSGGKQTKCK